MEGGGGNNWRPPQQQQQQQQKPGEPSLSVPMEAASSNHEWQSQLPPEARQRIVSKIMDTLKRHLPISAPEGLGELQKIAVRFEEKIYNAATSQADYLRKISMKMLTMEQKNPNTSVPNPVSTNSNIGQVSPDAANVVQVRTMTSQPQAKQILAPNVASSIMPTALEVSSSMAPTLLGQSTSNIGQNSNMQSIPGISQTGQGVTGNLYASQQQRRQFQQPIVSQQPQQSQNQHVYQQQQFIKQKVPSLLQPSISQQQKPQLMHATLQSQQTMAMSSGLQPSQTSLQNQQSSVLQPVPQSMQHSQQSPIQQGGPMYQQSTLRQQQTPQKSTLQQQPSSLSQQSATQQQMLNQRAFAPNILSEMQQQRLQQQHSGLANQQNALLNMQQSQRAMNQKNIPMHQQQQLATQGSLSGLLPQHQQQQPSQQISQHQNQVPSSQSSAANLQQHPQTVNMLQQSKPAGQAPQSSGGLLQLQGAQASQQQHMTQLQPQSIQAQQPLPTQQQTSSLQREMHQRHQAPVPLDSTAQTTQIGADVQEEVYQKIKSMKEMYYPTLHEMRQKLGLKLQQHEGLVLAPKQSEQLETLRKLKTTIERMIQILVVQKTNITAGLKEKIPYYEKQINNLVNNNRKKHASHAQGQQFQQPGTISQPMQQQSSQVTQLQQTDALTNPAQQMSMPMTVASAQSTAVSNIQSGSIPPTSLVSAHSTTQNIDASQGTALSSLQQSAIGSLQHGNLGTLHQAPINAQQQNSINTLMHNTGSTMQSTVNPLQQNSNVLQHQQMKQEHQHLMQAQQLKQQFHQRQLQQRIQQQQKQQILQQQPQTQPQQQQQLLQQKQLQQQASQVPPHQMQQLNQVSEVNARNVMKPGVFQSHSQAGQMQAYYQQQLKSSSPFSPQAPSPLMPQHSSPQVDQQALPSHQKSGTPIQSSTPPLVVPSPSTPLAASPLPGDHEKQPSGIPSLAGAGNTDQQQLAHGQAQGQSLAVGTPGISASPLLAELESLAPNASTVIPGKSSSVEQPIERLIKAVKSSSRAALYSAVNDIGSVVSMIDRIAGSAPGFGSKMAVGEDLAAMTRCRLQAKNFMSQDGSATTRKMKRQIVAMPFDALPSAFSVNESCKRSLAVDTFEESTTSPDLKRLNVEVSHVLLNEIKEINQQLIETVVDVVDDDVDGAADGGEGTVVKFTFCAVALSPNLKSHLASSNVSPILPLHLLIPRKYPKFSPIVLDKMPAELSSEESEDLSAKTRSRFGISLQALPETMSLKDMAKAWDASAREVILQYAKQNGGGSFSSKYGTWEKCEYMEPSCTQVPCLGLQSTPTSHLPVAACNP